jgi:hypothetical protein
MNEGEEFCFAVDQMVSEQGISPEDEINSMEWGWYQACHQPDPSIAQDDPSIADDPSVETQEAEIETQVDRGMGSDVEQWRPLVDGSRVRRQPPRPELLFGCFGAVPGAALMGR